MTRINLVPPSELSDQHLFAEFREIKMVPKSLLRSLAAARKNPSVLKGQVTAAGLVCSRIPRKFTLNSGHVTFFYDKGMYLRARYAALRQELDKRFIRYNRDSVFDPDGVMLLHWFSYDYTPTPEALAIIRARIAEKIAMKPEWYRYKGVSGVL